MNAGFRRKAPRRDYFGLLGVLYKGNMIMTSCRQVGEGGALIQGCPEAEGIEKDDHIVLTAFFPRIGGVVTKAQCLYRTESGNIGVAFRNLNVDYKKRIREYVSGHKI